MLHGLSSDFFVIMLVDDCYHIRVSKISHSPFFYQIPSSRTFHFLCLILLIYSLALDAITFSLTVCSFFPPLFDLHQRFEMNGYSIQGVFIYPVIFHTSHVHNKCPQYRHHCTYHTEISTHICGMYQCQCSHDL